MTKNRDRQRKKNKPTPTYFSWKPVWIIVGGITAVLASIVTWLDFGVYLQSGSKAFLWAFVLFIIVLWFVILWLLYKQKSTWMYLWIAVTAVGMVVTGIWFTSIQQAKGLEKAQQEEGIVSRKQKFIVLIAEFDDTSGDSYGLRNEIVEKLNADFADDNQVLIETVDEIIKPGSQSGSARARELGESMQADLVIWGWYIPKQNPNITIHFENLSPGEIEVLDKSQVYRPAATIADLQSIEIQRQLGAETSSLLSFVVGYIQYKLGNFESALQRFEQTNQVAPLFVKKQDILLLVANIHIQLDQDNLALEKFNEIISVDETSYQAFANRGIAYTSLGNYDKAMLDYQHAIQLNPEYSPVYVNLGILYILQDHYENAIAQFNQAIAVDPNLAAAYYSRGNAYGELGQVDKAIEDATKTIDLDPNFANAFILRGISYGKQKLYDLAISDFNEALRLTPNSALTYYSRGLLYERAGQYEEAVSDYSQAISIDPGYYEAYVNRIFVNKQLDRLEATIGDYTQLISLFPNDPYFFIERGYMYAALNKFDLAVLDFTDAIRLKPNDADYYNTRGAAYHELEQYDHAIADLEKSISINPNFVTPHFNLGNTYDDLGKLENAISEYAIYIDMVLNIPGEHRVKFLPSLADAYYYRGIDYQKLEKNTEAQADFVKYKELTGKDAP